MQSVNLTSKRPDGSAITQNISNVNPDAAESDVALFMAHVAKLSDNTLTNIEKVEAEKVDISGRVSIQLADEETTYDNIVFEHAQIKSSNNSSTISNVIDDAEILTFDGADSIFNSAAEVTISAGSGDDTIFNTGDFVTLDAGAGVNTFQFNAFSGNATINNLTESDTIVIFGVDKFHLEDIDGGKLLWFRNTDILLNGVNFEPKIELPDKDNVVMFVASTGADSITVGAGQALCQRTKKAASIVAAPSEGKIYGGVNAGNGADKLLVQARDLSIFGGSGSDSINIQASPNVYIYTFGNGKESIYGWAADDSLVVLDEKIDQEHVSVSADGSKFYLKFSGKSSYIYFDDVQTNDKIKGAYAEYEGDSLTPFEVTVPRGVGSTDEDAVIDTRDIQDSTSQLWFINANTGNDTIINDKDNAVINVLSGHDSISNSGDNCTIKTILDDDNFIELDGAQNNHIYISLDSALTNVTITGYNSSNYIHYTTSSRYTKYSSETIDGGLKYTFRYYRVLSTATYDYYAYVFLPGVTDPQTVNIVEG